MLANHSVAPHFPPAEASGRIYHPKLVLSPVLLPVQDMGPAAEAAASAALAAAAAAELPCTVKLRVWPHDINKPTALLDPEKCRLTIPHAVLCRLVSLDRPHLAYRACASRAKTCLARGVTSYTLLSFFMSFGRAFY